MVRLVIVMIVKLRIVILIVTHGVRVIFASRDGQHRRRSSQQVENGSFHQIWIMVSKRMTNMPCLTEFRNLPIFRGLQDLLKNKVNSWRL